MMRKGSVPQTPARTPVFSIIGRTSFAYFTINIPLYVDEIESGGQNTPSPKQQHSHHHTASIQQGSLVPPSGTVLSYTE